MKIGDEVYVHGYVDEIRNDVVIIRNDGGYFGTVLSEIERIYESKADDYTCRISACKYFKNPDYTKCEECMKKQKKMTKAQSL